MLPKDIATLLMPLDALALGYFLVASLGYGMIERSTFLGRRSLVGAIQEQRVKWMLNMSARGDQRTLDVILLNTLVQGNAFFASTTAIAIGGIAAILGSGERAQGLLDRLPYAASSTALMWEVKLMLIMAIFIFAFFKFAWAFRLGHYTAIMIGSTPERAPGHESSCDAHAHRTARVAGLSAEHSNGGLRSFYYAIAALAWFYHPIAMIAATTWVLLILIRRDFFSRSRRLILEDVSGNHQATP
jgi:uncharacterized membrane protein